MDKKTLRLYKKYLKDGFQFMCDHGYTVKPYPKITLDDKDQGDTILMKTGYFDPEKNSIVLKTHNRAIKDVMRTFFHECIHWKQQNSGTLEQSNYQGDRIVDDENLKKIESEAYLLGNIAFRSWTETLTEECRPNFYEKKNFLNESLLLENEGTNMKKARRFLEQHGYTNPSERQKILDAIRTGIPNSRLMDCYYLLGVTRLYIEGQLSDGQNIRKLNTALKYIATDAHAKEYDNNLNNLSLQEIDNRFSGVAKSDLIKNKELSNQKQLNRNNDYKIVKIPNFESAEQYGKYTDWCVTHYEDMYDSYTNNSTGLFYFCLKNGFENIPRDEGDNCPLDEYGLSMIAVSVTMEGECNTITCRWNHNNGGNDNIMTVDGLEELLGVNFYQTFLPYTREELHAKGIILFDEVQGLLDSGKSPKEIFDYVDSFYEGFVKVELNNKWNFINTEGKLISNQWFDYVLDFYEGFAAVELTNKYNSINTEGKLISNQWFDYVFDFYGGFAEVELTNKYNFINTEGKLISNQWFDDTYNFSNGFARVKLNNEWYYLDTNGNLHDEKPNNLNEVKRISEDNESIPEKCTCGGDINLIIKGEPVWCCNKCGKYYGTYPKLNEDTQLNNWFAGSKVVDSNGNPLPMYHCTNNDFSEFSHEYLTHGSTAYMGVGFYFTLYEENGYGKNVHKVYINARNPITNLEKTISCKKLSNIIYEIDKDENPNSSICTNKLGRIIERCDMSMCEKAARSIYDYSDDNLDIYQAVSQIYCGDNNVKIIRAFEGIGYDSAILYDDNGHIQKVIAFEPSQIKDVNSFNNTLNENVDLPQLNILPCFDYYNDEGIREICHRIKDGDENAIQQAAEIMSHYVNSNNILVPIPSHDGMATTSLKLANAIATIVGCEVKDILNGNKRERIYDLKKQGREDFDDNFFGFNTTDNASDNAILVDNVIGTGSSAKAASNATGIKNILVLARDNSTNNLLNEGTEYDEYPLWLDVAEDYGDYELLAEFLDNKDDGIKQKRWSLIPASQYHNLLRRYMMSPEMSRIPYNTVFSWFKDIIIKNTLAIEYITNFAGHSMNFPIDAIEAMFPEQEITDYKDGAEFLEEIGFYDWCKLPDGSDAWSDFGLTPLFNIINEYRPNSTAEEILILINRCLDVYHCRGDLASAFIEGGSKSCFQISNSLNENIDEFTNPEDVDMSSFAVKDNLNDSIWNNGKLNNKVRLKLLDVAEDFIDTLSIEIEPEDIIMTGSLANYNWSVEYSDIDLHILVDFSAIDENTDLVKDFFDSKKKIWNEEHNIKLKGFPIEIYVQDVNEKHISSGVYSLISNKWLIEPSNDFNEDNINLTVKTKIADYMNQIDDMSEETPYDEIVDLFHKIKDERKKGFEKGGDEYNPGNLIFKTLRRNGYIEKLLNLKTKVYDLEKSL